MHAHEIAAPAVHAGASELVEDVGMTIFTFTADGDRLKTEMTVVDEPVVSVAMADDVRPTCLYFNGTGVNSVGRCVPCGAARAKWAAAQRLAEAEWTEILSRIRPDELCISERRCACG